MVGNTQKHRDPRKIEEHQELRAERRDRFLPTPQSESHFGSELPLPLPAPDLLAVKVSSQLPLRPLSFGQSEPHSHNWAGMEQIEPTEAHYVVLSVEPEIAGTGTGKVEAGTDKVKGSNRQSSRQQEEKSQN